jgi:hypothetical protein
MEPDPGPPRSSERTPTPTREPRGQGPRVGRPGRSTLGSGARRSLPRERRGAVALLTRAPRTDRRSAGTTHRRTKVVSAQAIGQTAKSLGRGLADGAILRILRDVWSAARAITASRTDVVTGPRRVTSGRPTATTTRCASTTRVSRGPRPSHTGTASRTSGAPRRRRCERPPGRRDPSPSANTKVSQ